MADLSETLEFPAGIYQLEEGDPVHGGTPDLESGQGFDNIPHQQLANRTTWLKAQLEEIALNAVTQADIDAAISALLSDAPGALDTLNELAAALGDDADFAGTVAASLGLKLNTAEFTGPNVEALLSGEGGAVLKRVSTPASGDLTTAHHWCKIATFDLTGPAAFSEASAHLRAYGENRAAAGTIEFLVQSRKSGSGALNASIDILSASMSEIFAPDCLRLVEVELNSTLDLWIKSSASWSKMQIYEVRSLAVRDAFITYVDGGAWQAAEPGVIAGGTSIRSQGVTAFSAPVATGKGVARDVQRVLETFDTQHALSNVGNAFVDTPFSASITLTDAANSVELSAFLSFAGDHVGGHNRRADARIVRRVAGLVDVPLATFVSSVLGSNSEQVTAHGSIIMDDVPGTTDEVSYVMQVCNNDSGTMTIRLNSNYAVDPPQHTSGIRILEQSEG